MSVVSCVDGVFCVIKDCYCKSDIKIYLWNPALRQSILLPRDMKLGRFTLAVGFGYDNESQDYKVAKFHLKEGGNIATYKLDVYSLKTHSWTTLLTPVDKASESFRVSRQVSCRNFPIIIRACVILDGYFYWNDLYWYPPYEGNGGRIGLYHVRYVHMTRENDSGHFVVPDYVSPKSRELIFISCGVDSPWMEQNETVSVFPVTYISMYLPPAQNYFQRDAMQQGEVKWRLCYREKMKQSKKQSLIDVGVLP
ncbi:OLC1v1003764C1 [Oldenlandia corymbosa var. corymbosa]|uniref:OLC1v1003764C1 n=1 Tax=Oldenlandia corymbosa var. corymbosa TaxID=529605 RepID=A0AAV1DAS3_OLDCO|nr:OLC1v1003764C1 [Oldenlandia corymbosa var. corymbosa]